jgi:phytoene dehydrogenase-like protein
VARVAVLSGGFGGLAAAARLTRLGHDVTVLEHSDALGAPAGRYERDGFRFDTGATHVSLPAALRDLFRKSGRPLEEELDLVPIEPAARYVLPGGGLLDLPNASRAGTRQALTDEFGPDTARGWDALINHGQRVWEVLHRHAYEPERRLSWRERRVLATGTPLLRTASRHLRDRGVRPVLEHLCLEAGFPPRKAPSTLLALAYIEQTFGVWRVRGGLYQVVEVLVERIKDRAVIRTGVDDHATDREIQRADVVVTEAPPYVPTKIITVALNERTEAGAERTILSPGVTLWRPVDAAMRPEGCDAWTVQQHVVAESAEWAALRRSVAGQVRWSHDVPPPHMAATPTIHHPHHYQIIGSAQLGATLPFLAMSAARVATLIGRA